MGRRLYAATGVSVSRDRSSRHREFMRMEETLRFNQAQHSKLAPGDIEDSNPLTRGEITSLNSEEAAPAITPNEFIVPISRIPFNIFSALVRSHEELADSFVHSIKHIREPSDTSNYLEIYLFLPRQPPPYFIRFHLPPVDISTPGTDNSKDLENYLDGCMVSFTAHTSSSMPPSDPVTELKFKMQPTLLFLDHTLRLVGQELSSGTTPLQSDIFCTVALSVFQKLNSPSGIADTEEYILSEKVLDSLRKGLKRK